MSRPISEHFVLQFFYYLNAWIFLAVQFHFLFSLEFYYNWPPHPVKFPTLTRSCSNKSFTKSVTMLLHFYWTAINIIALFVNVSSHHKHFLLKRPAIYYTPTNFPFLYFNRIISPPHANSICSYRWSIISNVAKKKYISHNHIHILYVVLNKFILWFMVEFWFIFDPHSGCVYISYSIYVNGSAKPAYKWNTAGEWVSMWKWCLCALKWAH